MALQVKYVAPPERVANDTTDVVPAPAEFPDAYARILTVRATARECHLLVVWHETQEARFSEEQPINIQEFAVATPVLAGDLYPASYAYLKTLPLFAGAVDVLETPVVEEPAPVDPPAVEVPADGTAAA